MNERRLHYLQHVPFEGLGYISSWAREKGFEITSTQLWENDPFPSVHDFDWLVIMGGPMSVNDEEKHPWLKHEKQFIKSAIEQNKVVIGICLGAQLIANSLGARVFPNEEKEIGWFPVSWTESGNRLFNDLPHKFITFHWHGEIFELPEDGQLIATSERCKYQAFAYKDHVFAFQFHPEVTSESVYSLLENCRNELVEGKYIQTEQAILNGLTHVQSNNHLMHNILEAIGQNELKTYAI